MAAPGSSTDNDIITFHSFPPVDQADPAENDAPELQNMENAGLTKEEVSILELANYAFGNGNQLFQKEKYKAAQKEFQKALDLIKPHAALVSNQAAHFIITSCQGMVKVIETILKPEAENEGSDAESDTEDATESTTAVAAAESNDTEAVYSEEELIQHAQQFIEQGDVLAAQGQKSHALAYYGEARRYLHPLLESSQHSQTAIALRQLCVDKCTTLHTMSEAKASDEIVTPPITIKTQLSSLFAVAQKYEKTDKELAKKKYLEIIQYIDEWILSSKVIENPIEMDRIYRLKGRAAVAVSNIYAANLNNELTIVHLQLAHASFSLIQNKLVLDEGVLILLQDQISAYQKNELGFFTLNSAPTALLSRLNSKELQQLHESSLMKATAINLFDRGSILQTLAEKYARVSLKFSSAFFRVWAHAEFTKAQQLCNDKISLPTLEVCIQQTKEVAEQKAKEEKIDESTRQRVGLLIADGIRRITTGKKTKTLGIRLFIEARQLYPQNPEVYYEFASLCLADNQIIEAYEFVCQALRYNPEHQQALLLRSEISTRIAQFFKETVAFDHPVVEKCLVAAQKDILKIALQRGNVRVFTEDENEAQIATKLKPLSLVDRLKARAGLLKSKRNAEVTKTEDAKTDTSSIKPVKPARTLEEILEDKDFVSNDNPVAKAPGKKAKHKGKNKKATNTTAAQVTTPPKPAAEQKGDFNATKLRADRLFQDSKYEEAKTEYEKARKSKNKKTDQNALNDVENRLKQIPVYILKRDADRLFDKEAKEAAIKYQEALGIITSQQLQNIKGMAALEKGIKEKQQRLKNPPVPATSNNAAKAKKDNKVNAKLRSKPIAEPKPKQESELERNGVPEFECESATNSKSVTSKVGSAAIADAAGVIVSDSSVVTAAADHAAMANLNSAVSAVSDASALVDPASPVQEPRSAQVPIQVAMAAEEQPVASPLLIPTGTVSVAALPVVEAQQLNQDNVVFSARLHTLPGVRGPQTRPTDLSHSVVDSVELQRANPTAVAVDLSQNALISTELLTGNFSRMLPLGDALPVEEHSPSHRSVADSDTSRSNSPHTTPSTASSGNTLPPSPNILPRTELPEERHSPASPVDATDDSGSDIHSAASARTASAPSTATDRSDSPAAPPQPPTDRTQALKPGMTVVGTQGSHSNDQKVNAVPVVGIDSATQQALQPTATANNEENPTKLQAEAISVPTAKPVKPKIFEHKRETFNTRFYTVAQLKAEHGIDLLALLYPQGIYPNCPCRIPPLVLAIMNELQRRGFRVRLGGGAIRSLLSGIWSTDWDLTSNAPPGVVAEVMHRVVANFYPMYANKVNEYFDMTQGKISLCTLALPHLPIIEVSPFYGYQYVPGKIPGDIEAILVPRWDDEDPATRDFTINDLSIEWFSSHWLQLMNGEWVLSNPEWVLRDGTGKGLSHVKGQGKRIETCDPPELSLKWDSTRIGRAYYFKHKLDFPIEEKLLAEIRTNFKEYLASLIGNKYLQLTKLLFKILRLPIAQRQACLKDLKDDGVLAEICAIIEAGFKNRVHYRAKEEKTEQGASFLFDALVQLITVADPTQLAGSNESLFNQAILNRDVFGAMVHQFVAPAIEQDNRRSSAHQCIKKLADPALQDLFKALLNLGRFSRYEKRALKLLERLFKSDFEKSQLPVKASPTGQAAAAIVAAAPVANPPSLASIVTGKAKQSDTTVVERSESDQKMQNNNAQVETAPTKAVAPTSDQLRKPPDLPQPPQSAAQVSGRQTAAVAMPGGRVHHSPIGMNASQPQTMQPLLTKTSGSNASLVHRAKQQLRVG